MSRKFFAADTMPAAKRRFYTHFWQVCITLIAFWSLSPIPLFCTRSSKNLLQLQCVESVKPEAMLSLYGRCTQRSLSYYITHPVHFPACVSQRDRMPRLVHQHNFILPSEGVEGPLHIKATALPDGNRIGACHRLHASSKEAANGMHKLFPYYIKGAIGFIYRLLISRDLYASTVSDFSLYPYNKSQTVV